MESQILTNPSSCHVLTFLFTTLLFISQHTKTVSASTAPQAYTNFIRTSCKTTTYPSLCYQTISPYASSVQTNPLNLCNAALTITIKAARNTSKMVARQKGITSRDASAIKDCIENIGNSIDELKKSLKAMGRLGRSGSGDKRFQMANIKTWISAAITDENTCTDGFFGRKVTISVKNKIANGILGITRLASNALSLVNHLNYYEIQHR